MLSLPTLIFAIVASYLIQFAVFIGWGTLIAYAIREPDQSIFGTLLLGLFGVTFALLTIHFFWPINFAVAVTVALPAGFGAYLWLQKFRNQSLSITKLSLIFTIGLLLLILYLPHLYFLNGDTGLYYFQKVLWYNEHPVWPGLALLHSRFGFNVSFFLSTAMLRQIVPYNEALHYSVVSFWLASFLIYLLTLAQKRKGSIQKLFISLFVLFFTYLFLFVAAGVWGFSPDPVLTVIILYLLITIIIALNQNSIENSSSLLIIVALAISIKLSAILQIIPILSLLWISNLRNQKWWPTFIVVGLFGFLFILHGYLESGYLSYPAQFTFGKPDWRLSNEARALEGQWVTVWARSLGNLSFEETLHTWKWLPIWIKTLWNPYFSIGVISSFIISLAVFTFRRNNIKTRLLIPFFTLLCSSIVAWFFVAPDPRFGLATLLFIMSFSIYLVVEAWPKSTDRLFNLRFWITITMVFFGLLTIYRMRNKPLQFIPMPTANVKMIPNLGSQPIDGEHCWTTPIPCSWYWLPNLTKTTYTFGPFQRQGYILRE